MSILKLTEDNINDKIYIRYQEEFQCTGTLISISDNFYEIKENSGDITRIYEFEINEIDILTIKDQKNLEKTYESPNKFYEHPIFGKLSKSKNSLEFLGLNESNILDSDNMFQCKYALIKSHNEFNTRVFEILKNASAIGLSCYTDLTGDMKVLNISNGFITAIIEISDAILDYHHEIKDLMESKLCITCKGPSLVEFIQNIFDIKIPNFIDLQIFHYGLHNLKSAQVLKSPASYSKLVSILFGCEFKQLTSSVVSYELIVEKMAFNTHFLVGIFEKFLSQLIEPLKNLSRQICVPQLDSEKLLGREGRQAIDFEKLPRSLQFWSYKETPIIDDIKKFRNSKTKGGIFPGINKNLVLEDAADFDSVTKQWADDKDEKTGRIMQGYYEKFSDDEDFGHKWNKELKDPEKIKDYMSDDEYGVNESPIPNPERIDLSSDIDEDKSLKNIVSENSQIDNKKNEISSGTLINNEIKCNGEVKKKLTGIGRGRGRPMSKSTISNIETKKVIEEPIINLSESFNEPNNIQFADASPPTPNFKTKIERNINYPPEDPDEPLDRTPPKTNYNVHSPNNKILNKSNEKTPPLLCLQSKYNTKDSFKSNDKLKELLPKPEMFDEIVSKAKSHVNNENDSKSGFLSKRTPTKDMVIKPDTKITQKSQFPTSDFTPRKHKTSEQFEDVDSPIENITVNQEPEKQFLTSNNDEEVIDDSVEIISVSSEHSRKSELSMGRGTQLNYPKEEHYCEYRFFGGNRAGLTGRPGEVDWKKPGFTKSNTRNVSGRICDKSSQKLLPPASYGRGIFWSASPAVNVDTDQLTDELYREFNL